MGWSGYECTKHLDNVTDISREPIPAIYYLILYRVTVAENFSCGETVDREPCSAVELTAFTMLIRNLELAKRLGFACEDPKAVE